jgi:hypothetical protein
MTRWCARTLLGVTLGFVLGSGCSVDDDRYNFGDEAGAAGVAGARSPGASGAAGKGATGGRGSTQPTAGGFASGVGGSFAAAGSGGNAAPGGVNGQGAVSALGGTNANPNPVAGTAGTNPPAATGVCVAGNTEPCGDCGTRTCDSVRLDWNACIGTGIQQDCWETPEGAALPGEMPTVPKGKCTVGGQTCQADGTWSACTGAVAPAASDDCSVAGDDSNCSGMPNDGCNCSPGMMRACGTDAGNCQQGQQVCTANTWGPCLDEVKPLANDSCLVTGDDATCNGLPNEACLCVADNPMACNDNVACTDNVCTNGVCSNPTSAGFCRIGGQCYPDGASEPGNPCRFCDADVNRTGWSNSPSTVKCDDGQWCNGNDVCSAGSCTHEFTTNRCTASGPCALSACDEARDSCFRPNTFDCSSNVETRCASSSCGADVQNRTIARKCSGSSAACDGATSTGSWTTSTDCSNDQVCQASGSNYSCAAKLGCGSTWCNGALCWTTTNPGKRTAPAAATFCANLTLAGESNWRIATIFEYFSILNGCDGRTGTARSGAGTCRFVDNQFVDCTACPSDGGPGNSGCYWPAAMGTCDTSDSATAGYWSAQPSGAIPLGFDPDSGNGFFYPTVDAAFQFRCVTDN